MIGSRLEIDNLRKIYDFDVKRKCIDDSEKVRKEIMMQLLKTNKIIGVIAYSNLCVSSIELYQIESAIAISFCYLNLCCREEHNKLLYCFSKDVNSITSAKEIEYSTPSNTANIIVNDLLKSYTI